MKRLSHYVGWCISAAIATLIVPLLVIAVWASDETRVEIRSEWYGLGSRGPAVLTITGRDGKFSANGHSTSAQSVQRLVAALQEAPVEKPTLEQCGITEAWLQANYKQGLEEYTHGKLSELSPKQVELFKTQFTNPQVAGAAFSEMFQHWHTDDYPEISISVTRAGNHFGVQSKSQYPFMLPWSGIDDRRGGYNCHISSAVAELLPAKFPNAERLLPGHSFRWDLTSGVMDSIQHEWDLLDTAFKVGPEVAPIFATYTPVESAISNLSSIDLDGTEAWNAKLRSKDLPHNLIFGASLAYRHKRLKGADQFLQTAPKYARLVLSVPWLYEYLTTNPGVTAEIRYVDGRSLSPKAEGSLTEDLRTHSKAELAEKVSNEARQSAFIEVNSGDGCWSRVVVLPSKEVLLWHFDKSCKSALGIDPSNLETWDYYGWLSVGALFSQNGKVTTSGPSQ